MHLLGRGLRAPAALLAFGALLVLPASAGAGGNAPITVTKTSDEVTPNDGCSLREAISAVNDGNTGPGLDCPSGAGISTIELGAGGYVSLIPGPHENDNATGDFDIKTSMTIQGVSSGSTVVSGIGTDRVFHVQAGTVEIKDLKVTGGKAPDGGVGGTGTNDAGHSTGGTGGTGEDGGGVLNDGSDDLLTLTDVLVDDNSAGDGGAGGVPAQAHLATGGSGGEGGRGGGVANQDGATLHLVGTRVTNNFAGDGGAGGAPPAPSNGGTAGDGTATAGSNAEGGLGGNGGSGGGISSSGPGGALLVNNSAISGNKSGRGGDGAGGGDAGNGGDSNAGDSDGAPGGGSLGGNGGTGGGGGGVYMSNGTVDQSTVADNVSGDGGNGGTAGTGGNGGKAAPGGDLGPGIGFGGAGGGSSGGNAGAGGYRGGILADSGNVTHTLISENSGGAGGAGGGAGNGGVGGTANFNGKSGSTGPSIGGNGGDGGSGAVGNWSVGTSSTVFDSTVFNVSNTTVYANFGGDGGAGGGAGNGSGGLGGNGGNGGSGGAVQGLGGQGPFLTLLHATITSNSFGAGGAGGGEGTNAQKGAAGGDGPSGGVTTSEAGAVTLTNSIVASNGGSQCAGPSVADGGHNLSFPAGDTSCPADVSADPLLAPLTDNGGPTMTRALAPGSPALDAVPQTASDHCATNDQREVTRPRGPACDIGAYEAREPTAVTGDASDITKTSATVAGTLDPDGVDTTYSFQYGTDTSYGSSTESLDAGSGSGATPTNAFLSGLKPGTTYHYRLIATNAEGTSAGLDNTFKTQANTKPGGGGGTPKDTTPPIITAASLSPNKFAVDPNGAAAVSIAKKKKSAPRGTTVAYTLSEAANVVFTIEKKRPGRRVKGKCVKPKKKNHKKKHCARYKRAGRFAHESPKGATAFSFSGRIGTKKLKPGKYRAVLVATDAAGNPSMRVSLSFKVVKG